ncbi:hypothetical protein B0T10DRAFT_581439 [Thelonectria olida]|uniref:NACHT domain-containing protein n=1 Tax=Thelonectria olida TaxID=1576542 RepID=A0A9P9AKH3_9HYPO|nr:hypothetical protein B0T10DRAFT_581439 [Thelonectria olida]
MSRPLESRDTDIATLFSRAKQKFWDSLPDEDKRRFPTCQSAEDLVDSVRSLDTMVEGPRRRKALILIRKVQVFGERLGQYFKVVDILCSTQPEWANIVWGALRLVLQLASNFGSFLDKLCERLEQLGACMPRFEEVFTSLKLSAQQFTSRLPDALVNFYHCILDFCYEVTRIFIRKDGSTKRAAVYLASMLLQPFDNRFQDILRRMKACQEIVKEELDLALASSAQSKASETLEKISNQQEALGRLYDGLVELKSTFTEAENGNTTRDSNSHPADHGEQSDFASVWLDGFHPPPTNPRSKKRKGPEKAGLLGGFSMNHRSRDGVRQIYPGRLPKIAYGVGARSFGLRVEWAHIPHLRIQSLILVSGNPGAGKTILAGSTVELLQSTCQPNGSNAQTVCYYFFDRNTSQNSTRFDAWRAVVAQLFLRGRGLEQIRDICSLALSENLDCTSEQEFLDVLRLLVDVLPRVFLVMDGIDECPEAAQLLDDICWLCEAPNLRVALFSRPNVVPIHRPFLVMPIPMSKAAVGKDISRFLHRELGLLVESRYLPPHAESQLDSLVNHLVCRSDGMFLWARLMMTYLSSPALTPAQRREFLWQRTPDGIDDLYFKIFDLIRNQDKPCQQLARKVFLWCIHGFSELTTSQLQELISERSQSTDDQLVDIEHAVVMSCGGLVEKHSDNTVHFIHLTVKDFMVSNILVSPAGVTFTPSECEAACEITNICIRYLLFSLPLQPLSGNIADRATIDNVDARHPFLSHAALNWPFYLTNSFSMACDRRVSILGTSYEECLRTLQIFLAVYTLWSSQHMDISGPMRPRISAITAACTALDASPILLSTPSLDAKALRSDLGDFARDLSDLDRQWQSTLCERPQEIWNDVTLFTSSRFLQHTAAASCTRLDATRTASREKRDARFVQSATSTDGKRLGILRVWSSESFDMLWSRPSVPHLHAALGVSADQTRNHAQDDGELLSILSVGRYAQYEVFKTGSHLALLHTSDIDLRHEEIAMLLRQSLRQGALQEWKLSFPMAISSSLAIIVVLRSIYVIGASDALEPKDTKFRVSGPSLLDSAVLDPQGVNWSTRRVLFELPYLYNVKIGCDDKFLALQDEDMRVAGGNNHSLVVFNLDVQYRNIRTRYLGRFSYRITNRNDSLWELHGSQPWLIFCAFSNVYLWRLQDAESARPILAALVDGAQRIIEGIGFSHCGDYLTVKLEQQMWPEIFPLVSFRTKKHALADSPAVERKRAKSSRSSLELERAPGLTISGSLASIDRQGGGICLGQETGRFGSQSIELYQQPANTSDPGESARLVSLPSKYPAHTIRHVARIADSGDACIVILNKTQPRSYESDDISNGHGPMVIRRNLQSIHFEPKLAETARTPVRFMLELKEDDDNSEDKEVPSMSHKKVSLFIAKTRISPQTSSVLSNTAREMAPQVLNPDSPTHAGHRMASRTRRAISATDVKLLRA